MKRPVIAVLILAVSLGGCAAVRTSKLNPFNWFHPAVATATGPLYVAPIDARPLVAQVLTMKVEPFPGGAIIRATGLPPTQGYWKADLVLIATDDPSALIYQFRIFPPIDPKPTGAPVTREVTVATSLSDIRLAEVRSITVQGANNALSSNR